MIARCASWLLLLLTLCSAAASFADDKAIDDVDAGDFSFGSMAIGQAKDVDYARAEGLGLVPTSPLDTYLNGILAKLLAQSPVKNVPVGSAFLAPLGARSAHTLPGTDCEYITKCLCEKSLHKRRCISYPWRKVGVKANLALNLDAPKSGAPVSSGVTPIPPPFVEQFASGHEEYEAAYLSIVRDDKPCLR